MQMKSSPARLCAGLVALTSVVATSTSCGIEKQTAPPLAGPSEFAISISVTASPDTLVQDGESQSAITATVRNETGAPIPNVALQFSATASSNLIPTVSLTSNVVGTDSAGRATVGLIAPPPPAVLPTTDPVITVLVTPVGADFASQNPRLVQVRLTAPGGTLPANNNPVPQFTVFPAVGNINQPITFDASATTDEGQPCGSRCTFRWDFGDFTTDGGPIVTKTYTLPLLRPSPTSRRRRQRLRPAQR